MPLLVSVKTEIFNCETGRINCHQNCNKWYFSLLIGPILQIIVSVRNIKFFFKGRKWRLIIKPGESGNALLELKES